MWRTDLHGYGTWPSLPPSSSRVWHQRRQRGIGRFPLLGGPAVMIPLCHGVREGHAGSRTPTPPSSNEASLLLPASVRGGRWEAGWLTTPSGNKPCFAAMLSGGATWGERTRCPPLCQPGGVSRGLVQSPKSHLCSAVTRHPPSPSGVGEREDIRCAPTGGGWHRDSGGGLARSRAAYGIGWGAYVASSHWF